MGRTQFLLNGMRERYEHRDKISKIHYQEFKVKKMSNKFENDLKKGCKCAAEYLRKKHQRYNENSELKGKERLYSGEREFVAEVYRLLIEKEPSYRDKLFFEATGPGLGDDKKKVTPDLVYRNGRSENFVIEVKAPVNNRANGSALPCITDSNAIERDYEKLKENYSQFDSKFLVIAYLGDPILENGNEFPLKDFEAWGHHEFQDRGKIKKCLFTKN